MLDANATSASQLRFQYAQIIANACPSTLYSEIALTGSSARGIATDDSDIEINFWVHQLPSLEARRDWVKSLETQDVIAQNQPRPDNSYWVNARYKGIELEAGWQTFDDLDVALTQLIEAQTTDHKALRLAELVLSAKSLLGAGVLDKWQPILRNYPDDLAHKLIEDALSNWLTPNWLDNHLAEKTYKDDIHCIWRLIFALNHQWEINWKYAHHSLPVLEIYPKNIANRLGIIQTLPVEKASQMMLQLIQETLELIKSNYRQSKLVSQNLNQVQHLLDLSS
ncbi:MAG: hypothetical protein AAF846_24920 [Chloroflexota bacterium]